MFKANVSIRALPILLTTLCLTLSCSTFKHAQEATPQEHAQGQEDFKQSVDTVLPGASNMLEQYWWGPMLLAAGGAYVAGKKRQRAADAHANTDKSGVQPPGPIPG